MLIEIAISLETSGLKELVGALHETMQKDLSYPTKMFFVYLNKVIATSIVFFFITFETFACISFSKRKGTFYVRENITKVHLLPTFEFNVQVLKFSDTNF